MDLEQVNVTLKSKTRGFHLITGEILSALGCIKKYEAGMLHLMLQHTSASLCLNENADPSVRGDFEKYFKKSVPDGASYFLHVLEGDDDMTAHLKSAIIGNSLSIPIRDGKLALGIWQGIYLGEHRISAGSRSILCTLFGKCGKIQN